VGANPEIVVVTTTRRQSLAQNAQQSTRRQARADDVPPSVAGPRQGAPDRARAAREGVRHLADHHLVRPGAAGAPPGLRAGACRREARRPPRGGGRQPAAPVRVDAGRPGAGGRAGAAVPGRGVHRIRVPDQQRRGRLRDRRRPGAGRQAAGTACAVSDAEAHLVRRPARPAQLRRAGPRQPGRAGGRRPVARHVQRAPVRRRGGALPARRRGRDVLHQRHHRQPEGRGAHARHAAGPRDGRPAFRPSDRARRGAGLHAAGLDRPEHLQLRAVAGLRLRGELPRESGRPTTSRRRASSRACSPA